MKYFLVLICVVGCAAALSVSAHTTVHDGAISAQMHVEPNHQPIVGQPATLSFDFSESQVAFKPVDCDCGLEIEFDGNLVIAKELFADDSDGLRAVHEITFAEAGSYDVTLRGLPKDQHSFAPFTLTYEINVGAADSSVSHEATDEHEHHETNHLYMALFLGIAPLASGVITIRELLAKRKKA